MRRLNNTSEFVLTYILIKDEVKRLFDIKMGNRLNVKSENIRIIKPTLNSIITKLICEPMEQLLKVRFEYWIQQRSRIS
jgi:hypothetical protein